MWDTMFLLFVICCVRVHINVNRGCNLNCVKACS